MSANSPAFLQGRRLVITRPSEQSKTLINMIEDVGGECISFPLIEIVALEDYRSFDAHLDNLAQFDMVVFISANAVEQAMKRCQAHAITFPAQLTCVAVGPSTAQALKQHGIQRVLMPEQQFDSEGVLLLPQFQHLQHQRILLVKGEGGRDHLASVMQQRGAQVINAICYRRSCPQQDTRVLDEAWKQGGFDGILLTSSEAMRTFLKLAQHQAWLSKCKIFVNHPRVATQAEHVSGLQIIIAPSTDDIGMFAALKQEFHQA